MLALGPFLWYNLQSTLKSWLMLGGGKMKEKKLFLSMGFSPGYLKKIGINFFVAAGIMAFLMVANVFRMNNVRIAVILVFFGFGLGCFGVSSLKMKYCKHHWQKIGEPETAPMELRRSAKHFAEFGLVILAFIMLKSLLLKIWPDGYDITGIVVPFLICVYLLWESRKQK